MIASVATLDAAKADAKSVGFRAADTCAYAPYLISGSSPLTPGASIVDIQELQTSDKRVVGFAYTDSRGVRFVQATAMMSLATIERLGFRFRPGDVVSDVRPFDGHRIGLTIARCSPRHRMSNLVIKNLDREMRAAFYNGVDVMPEAQRHHDIDNEGLSIFGPPLPTVSP